MKPIIIEMRDMSDSTEVYQSKPNPVLAGFIYLMLAMVVTALVWMYFFKIDVVVKGTGTVATAEEVATVTNQVSGTIMEKLVTDGQVITKGEVLYTVSTESQELQLAVLEKQLADNVEKTEMLKAYESWLESGEELPDALIGNLYYSEISTRKNMVELGKESTLQSHSGELSAYEVKLDANTGMIAYYEEAIIKSKQMIEDIKCRTNSFSEVDTYYWNIVENFLVQYQNTTLQYEDKLRGLREERSNTEKGIKKLQELKNDLLKSQEPVQPLSVSCGDSGSVSQGNSVLSNTEQQLQELEKQIAEQEALLAVTDRSISAYILQKESALNAYEKDSIVTIENTIFNYQQNINSYKGANLEYENNRHILKSQGTELEVDNLVIQERYSVAEELEGCRQTKLQLEQQIDSLKQSIEEATVKATMSGSVNLATELVAGDYIAAGAQVLTIIPGSKEGEFIVRSYVENKDIAKIHEGMEVTYEIAAYPAREYGTMRGKVTFVSADLKVNNNGSAYYMVETSIDASGLINELGEEAALKVGMLCETKIVVEEKRVLEVLVEKLFHLTD